jgi:predicted  nucleic acid-binding Zn-ribbon protein
MGATLDALQRLQSIELQLRSARDQIESKFRTVDAQRRKIATLQRQATDIRDTIRRTQADADKLELERKAREAHLAKLREALNRSKTNKEYAAVLTQLNTDKADALKFEDQVLSALTKVDDLKKQAAEIDARLQKEQTRVAELEQAARDTEQKLAGSALEAQREEATEGIPLEALRLFERACEHHDGEGMAMIEQPHPKRAEYICSGCYMAVTLESINALQSRDAVITCPNCSRILYLESQALTV